MIVADINLPIYLYVNGPFTALAAQSLSRDPLWLIPPLYKFELLNVMATHVRKGEFDIARALQIVEEIERTVKVGSQPSRAEILRLSVASKIATYDCEYIALASEAGARVVTADKTMRKAFPAITVSLEDFAAGN